METMGQMAMTAFEIMTAKTSELEDGLYAALNGCDAYAEACKAIQAAELAKDEPNEKLAHRMGQFAARVAKIAAFVEDDALTEFVFLRDRLFSVELAEKGEFI